MPAEIQSERTKYELKLGVATREAFGRALVELGRENKDVVVCDADLTKSTMTTYFAKEFPDRFFECGIAEANMVAIGSGLAAIGKIPFVSSFSAFVINKGFEQLRVTAAYPHMNLKVVGTHSGISIGEDGPSQMSIEDLGLACALPGFVVISPADEVSTRALIHAAAAHNGPVFVRTGRPKVPIIYQPDSEVRNREVGRATARDRCHRLRNWADDRGSDPIVAGVGSGERIRPGGRSPYHQTAGS